MTTISNLTVTGVDIGSSSAKIAAVLKGGVEIITNQANFRQTPNVVGFGQKERLIGEAGQVKIKSNHSNTVTAPSRFLGFGSDCPYLKEQLKFCPAKIKPIQQQESSQLAFNLLYNNERQGFAPEQLVASYLTELQKIIAHTNNLSNKNMVITVPSYFTQHERQALLDAVEISKKKLNNEYATQLVNEEIAISMDYGYSKRNEFSQDLQKAHKVLFIDFGHSKTNLFVTGFNKQHLRVLANKFDRQLGCKFMDQELLKFYANHFDSTHPNMQLNLMESKKAVLKLLENIEKQRKVLSGNMEHDLSIQCLLEDQDIYYSMNRDQYENICQPVITKFKNLLVSFLDELKQKGITFDAIELVGGGTRIPAIIKTITEVFGCEPSRTVNSNECVAKGAALISAMNSSIFKVQPYSFFTLSPYPIQLKVNGHTCKNLIDRNEIILREKSIEFQVDYSLQKFTLIAEYPNQSIENGLQTRILQCEVQTYPKSTKSIEEGAEMKSQHEEKSNFKFNMQITFDQSGLIKLETIKSLSDQVSIKIGKLSYFEKFSKSQLDKMEQKEKEMTIRDLKIKKFYEKKNEYESLIYKTKHSIDTILSSNPEYISESQAKQIKSFVEEQENWLNSGLEVNPDFKLQDFTKRQKQLAQAVEQLSFSANQLKQNHAFANSELQKLAELLNEIISKRTQNMYPEEVNRVGEWINGIFQKQNSSPKFLPPVVSVEQIKQVHQDLIKKIKDFDLEMERQRQMSMRRGRQQRSTQGGFYRPETSYHPYGSHSGRQHEESYYKPRSTRNKGQHNNPFGSFFGSGFF